MNGRRVRSATNRALNESAPGEADPEARRRALESCCGIGKILGLDRIDERNLGFEETGNVPVKRAFRMEVFDGDPLRLTQAVAAVFGLRMIGRNPVEVLEDDVRSRRQRDADAARDDVADRDPDRWIGLEAVDGLHALLG